MAFRDDGREKEKIVEELLLNRYDSYYRLAWSYVHNGEDAADIVQNGAYKAILHSADLRRKEYAGTWIYRIMRNEIFNFLKRPRTVPIDSMGGSRKEGADTLSELSQEDSYEDIDLRRALNSLPPEDKLVVELRYFEDRKLDEIAEILDENLSTVKSRLYRSLKKMRKMLNTGEASKNSEVSTLHERDGVL